MPELVQESPFKTITVKELHPTFCAQVDGVNFPNPSEEQFQEVLAAMAKVSIRYHMLQASLKVNYV
jgi:alpha-ketoglutarate-dependent 2,4-dichlorophenoxyacetate dioxygenase